MNFKTILAIVLSIFILWQKVFAQDSQKNMSGAWLVVVEGESRTRTLSVISTKDEPGGVTVIDAEYGWTDGKKTPLKAKKIVTASGISELSFTTGAGSKVTASQTKTGVFEGRIVNGDDYNKKITIANEEATKQLALALKQPDSSVPVSCAVFFGSWKGRWTQWQVPEEKLLHITEVTPQCGIKFFYYPDTRYTTNWPGTSEIREGRISFLCNPADNGTCTFKIHGDELWADYSGTSGTNGGVFKKQQ